ncbi:hypothetical protein G6F52_014151 [Rhizopus delemar]|nr:hypothetical protein G6F52_014151 [Rhizopus delemar]
MPPRAIASILFLGGAGMGGTGIEQGLALARATRDRDGRGAYGIGDLDGGEADAAAGGGDDDELAGP